jgi:hypothetical protein
MCLQYRFSGFLEEEKTGESYAENVSIRSSLYMYACLSVCLSVFLSLCVSVSDLAQVTKFCVELYSNSARTSLQKVSNILQFRKKKKNIFSDFYFTYGCKNILPYFVGFFQLG